MQSKALCPIKQVRPLDLIDATTESPREISQKSGRTLMSLLECEIARGSANQLEINPDFPALAQEQIPVPKHTQQVASLPLGNYRYSLRQMSKVYRNTNFSTGNRGKLHAHQIVLRRELIPRILLNRQANLPQAPQEERSLSNRYVRGTLSLLPQVEWKPRFPD